MSSSQGRTKVGKFVRRTQGSKIRFFREESSLTLGLALSKRGAVFNRLESRAGWTVSDPWPMAFCTFLAGLIVGGNFGFRILG